MVGRRGKYGDRGDGGGICGYDCSYSGGDGSVGNNGGGNVGDGGCGCGCGFGGDYDCSGGSYGCCGGGGNNGGIRLVFIVVGTGGHCILRGLKCTCKG